MKDSFNDDQRTNDTIWAVLMALIVISILSVIIFKTVI